MAKETAGVLGRKRGRKHYRKLAQDCRKAFNEAFSIRCQKLC